MCPTQREQPSSSTRITPLAPLTLPMNMRAARPQAYILDRPVSVACVIVVCMECPPPDTSNCLSGCRENELVINAFLAPQMLLMSVPLVGPIVFVPVQAASAWLVDLLSRRGCLDSSPARYQQPPAANGNRDAMSYLASSLYNNVHPSRSEAAAPSGAAPTVPSSAPIFESGSPSQQATAPSSYYQQQ